MTARVTRTEPLKVVRRMSNFTFGTHHHHALTYAYARFIVVGVALQGSLGAARRLVL
ncbi:MAG: hypothetical protein HOP25_03355 [Methylotenera sp.]|nr:hypothetical protein [Methylotenera sp.]